MPLSLQYDFNGNLLNDENNTYDYDYENRLIKAITADNIIEYTYDAFGRRISKKIFSTQYALLDTQYYVYDGNQVIGEYDENGVLLRKYVYGTGIDEPIQVTRHTTQDTFYYHFDGLGSVVALTDSSGATVESYEYDVYGNTKIYDSSHVLRPSSLVGNPYGFTGRRFDEETGLYYYRARYYSPELGRFLQTDPIGYVDSMNLYEYCGNDGVNYIDPWGLESLVISNFPPRQNLGAQKHGNMVVRMNEEIDLVLFKMKIQGTGFVTVNARRDPYKIWNDKCNQGKGFIQVKLYDMFGTQRGEITAFSENIKFRMLYDPNEFIKKSDIPQFLKNAAFAKPSEIALRNGITFSTDVEVSGRYGGVISGKIRKSFNVYNFEKYLP